MSLADSPADVAALRERLAGFTVDAVLGLLGVDAWAALARNETTAGLRATAGDDSPLATLTRLFQLQTPVPRAAAEAALGDSLAALAAEGIVALDADSVTALADIRPYGDEDHDWWVVCDLTPGLDGRHAPMDPAFVLGISEASSSLAQLAVRPSVGRALDLGTGCGVQSLHLATHAREVVATDVNPRALAMARLTSALNGVPFEVRDGSLYDPVAGESFDLIVTNPPFVVSPPSDERLVYRETSFDGDDVVRHVAQGAAAHLNPGGWCQILASWEIHEGQPWDERVADWIGGSGLDAWVVQRERADLATYVELWLADAGLRGSSDYARRYDEWLAWLTGRGVEAMGFGWITLRRAGRAVPSLRFEEFTGPVAGPVGPDALAWAGVVDALDGADPLDLRWRLADDVAQVTRGPVGAADPATIELRRESGLLRSRQVDTVEAGLLSACDGDLTAGVLLDALATLLGRDPADLRATYGPRIAEFALDGFLAPPARQI